MVNKANDKLYTVQRRYKKGRQIILYLIDYKKKNKNSISTQHNWIQRAYRKRWKKYFDSKMLILINWFVRMLFNFLAVLGNFIYLDQDHQFPFTSKIAPTWTITRKIRMPSKCQRCLIVHLSFLFYLSFR